MAPINSGTLVSAQKAATENEVVEANAMVQVTVQLEHRADIRSLRDRANKYQAELEFCGEDLAKRVAILKMLSDVQKTAIALERQAFGIKDDAPEGGTADELIEMLKRGHSG